MGLVVTGTLAAIALKITYPLLIHDVNEPFITEPVLLNTNEVGWLGGAVGLTVVAGELIVPPVLPTNKYCPEPPMVPGLLNDPLDLI